MKRWFLLSLIILTVTLLAGCGTPAVPTTVTNGSGSYPEPFEPTDIPSGDESGGESGYPAQEAATEPAATTDPTPIVSQTTGAVTGRLLTQDQQPFYTDLYLGATLPESDSKAPPLISFSEQDSPRAEINPKTGVFSFNNVEPGFYSIIAWMPSSSIMLTDEEGLNYYFEVKANEVVEMGDIFMP
jgi:hypothetical protein